MSNPAPTGHARNLPTITLHGDGKTTCLPCGQSLTWMRSRRYPDWCMACERDSEMWAAETIAAIHAARSAS